MAWFHYAFDDYTQLPRLKAAEYRRRAVENFTKNSTARKSLTVAAFGIQGVAITGALVIEGILGANAGQWIGQELLPSSPMFQTVSECAGVAFILYAAGFHSGFAGNYAGNLFSGAALTATKRCEQACRPALKKAGDIMRNWNHQAPKK